MKARKSSKRLSLNAMTVSNLNILSREEIQGGIGTFITPNLFGCASKACYTRGEYLVNSDKSCVVCEGDAIYCMEQ